MLLLTLTSGHEIKVLDIFMYPEAEIWELLALRARAQKELSGYSNGIGLIGSPSWVLGGSLALGAVEAVMSGIKERKGIDLLNEAATRYDQLRRKGRWFSVDKINGIEMPQPSLWRVDEPQTKTIELASLGWGKKADIQTKYGLSNAEMKSDRVDVPIPQLYILAEQDFITCRDEQGELQVRWQMVTSMRLQEGVAS